MTKEDVMYEAGTFLRAVWRTVGIAFAIAFTCVCGCLFLAGLFDLLNGTNTEFTHALNMIAAAPLYLWKDQQAFDATAMLLMLVLGTVYWRLKFLGEGFRA